MRLVQHRLGHQPLVFTLDAVLHEEVRAGFSLQFGLPNDADIGPAVIVRFTFPGKVGLIWWDGNSGGSLLLDVVAAKIDSF